MKQLLLLASLAFSTVAIADQTSLSVPNESWLVKFESPQLQQIRSESNSRGYSYFGNAGKLNVSFFVEIPSCQGGENSDVRYTCFLEKSKKSPIMVPSTLRRVDAPNGLQVAYMVKTQVNGKDFSAINLHLLFVHGGKEADLHASILQPSDADLQALLSLMNSVKIVDK